MRVPEKFSSEGRAWRSVLIAVIIFSLTLTLVARFSITPNSQSRAVKSVSSRAGDNKRLDLDAVRFLAPPTSRASFLTIVASFRVFSSAPRLQRHSFGFCCSNRPPPPFLSSSR